jgi:hypothetical protein
MRLRYHNATFCSDSATSRGRRKQRVVVDTGVLVSAHAFGGVPERIRDAIARTESYRQGVSRGT